MKTHGSLSSRLSRAGVCAAAFAAGLGFASMATAEMAVVAVDGKVDRNKGKQFVVENGAAADNVTIIDLKATPPKVIAEIAAPTNVAGPPSTVAISPDESLVLVTAHSKIDPQDPKKLVADNRLTVIDLKAKKVVATLESGKSPAGVSFNAKGDLALVANRGDGTVSVFTVAGTTVTKAGSVTVGDEKSGPSHVAITPDGKSALVTLDGSAANAIAVLDIDGTKVTMQKRLLTAGVRPYGLDISPDGKLAVVAHQGRTDGDIDPISVIDLASKPARVVNTFGVGQTPEGVAFSPNGKFVAVTVMEGSGFTPDSPFYNDAGRVVVYAVNGTNLRPIAAAKIGHWSQGLVWSANGKLILAQNMVEKDVMVFAFDGKSLKDTGQRIALKAGGAAMRTATKR